MERQDWLEERDRLVKDKQELLEENIELGKDLLQLQQEHIAVLQQLASCHEAVQLQQQQQQQQQMAAIDEPRLGSRTSPQPEQAGIAQPTQQVLQQRTTAQLSPAKHHHHHHHHHLHHRHRHSSRPPLTPQHQPSFALLSSLSDGLCRDPCGSPCPASSRPASRAGQGSRTPRAKLHSSLQRLFGRTWVGQLQRSINSKPFSSSSCSADMADASSTATRGGSSSGNAHSDSCRRSSSGRNVVDVAVLTGMCSRVSGGGAAGAPQLQLREGIHSRASRISSGGATAAAALAAPHLAAAAGSCSNMSRRAGPAGSSSNGSSWRNLRPAALTHLRPPAAAEPATSSSGIQPIPASCSGQLATRAALQAAGSVGGISSSGLEPEAESAAAWEMYGPMSCPAAMLCETPWVESPRLLKRYSRGSSSRSSSAGSSISSGSNSSFDDNNEPAVEPVAGSMLSRLDADNDDEEDCDAAAAAAAPCASSAGCPSSRPAATAINDCVRVADDDGSGLQLGGALCAMSAAASGCLCGSTAALEDLAAITAPVVKGAASCATTTVAAAGKVEGSRTSSRIHSITSTAGSSSASSLAGSSSDAGCCSSTSGGTGYSSTSD
uniref:Uncharacterized protein n=1 Tax=Tetradesmus obliquus TaxID=3088 RepID=A0A383WER0_TETOB|eukprot:jgi/Sobl393_1/5343/SZX75652.1